jgi:hypothetical protein
VGNIISTKSENEKEYFIKNPIDKKIYNDGSLENANKEVYAF